MEKQEKICRFCLKNCGNNFKVMEESATEVLGVLLQTNLSISEEALMCSNCMESFKACRKFKSRCRDVEDFIVQFINFKNNNAKLDLKDIYLSRNACDVPEGHDICRLCMGLLRISSFISLDSEGGIVLEKMIDKCLPELDLHVTEKPVICAPCREFLQHYFGFVTNCLIVEEKIKKYCEAANGDGTSLIQLKDVLEFTTTNAFDKVGRIKMEDKLCKDEDHVDKQKCSNDVTCTSDNILTNKDVGKIKLEETIPEEIVCKSEEVDDQFDLIELKHSYCPEMVNEFELKQENLNSLHDILPPIEINNNLTRMQKSSVVQPHRTSQALLVTSGKKYHNRHLVANKSPLELSVYQCEHCSFQTKYSGSLKIHLLIHKNPSEITMNQCEFCSYQTKYKNNLSKHLLTHRDPLEIPMYQCKHCSFQTKYKIYLKTHLLIHKNPSEITMNQCEFCSYQTKYKSRLKMHLVTHKNPSKITMNRCEFCSFQTKHKRCLKAHLLTHKNPSETILYQCEHCSFQTKYKYNIKLHLQTHKCPSETTMYQCQLCPFQTKYKISLKNHMLVHKSPSEITMNQCDFCSFQTKHKQYLKKHLLLHNTSSKMTMIQCEHCSFQTKHKGYLKKHLLTHKNFSEMNVSV